MTALSTHMPFVMPINGKPYLFFSDSNDRITWTARYAPLDGSAPAQKFQLVRSTVASECSPDGFLTPEGRLSLSITENFELVQYVGRPFEMMTRVQSFGPCTAGTVTPTDIIIARAGNKYVEVIDRSQNVQEQWSFNWLGFGEEGRITRITFMSEQPEMVVLTGVITNMIFSVLFSRTTREKWWITVNRKPVYKCAFYQGVMYYAATSGAQFDDRQIVATTDYQLMPF